MVLIDNKVEMEVIYYICQHSPSLFGIYIHCDKVFEYDMYVCTCIGMSVQVQYPAYIYYTHTLNFTD